jgi:hypothetical protein
MRQRFINKFRKFISSTLFFYFSIGLFVLQAGWIAISAVYPMAFDEDYHFGLIQLYAHKLTPFFSSQPKGADIYGAVTRDPSYMYHYLMSFPYRLITYFTSSSYDQILSLRFINILFFTLGIYVFWRLLKYLKVSPSLTNLIIFFMALTPVTSLLAAQINYDNLLFPLVNISLLITIMFIKKLRQNKEFSILLLALLIIVCTFTSLVKYAFLPIFFVEFIYVGYIILVEIKANPKRFIAKANLDFKQTKKPILYLLTSLLIISSALFMERIGYNILKFHTPAPNCSQVISTQQCSQYGPWERNYVYTQLKSTFPHPTVYQYSRSWVHTMIYGMFFAINGINSGFLAKPPLPLPEWTAAFVAILGIIALVIYAKKIFHKNDILKFLLATILIYVFTLWLLNYSEYLQVGLPVAIQGRYLIPVILPIYLLIGLGISELLRKYYSFKMLLAACVIIFFLLGGGLLTYLIRNDPSWYNDNDRVVQVNKSLQKILVPIIPGSKLD